jgi:hypothetical protein
LYLIDPVDTFDLTFNNGNWYVPNPPIPAIILIPFVALWGVDGIDTVIFSLAMASITALFIFLILKELSGLHWIRLPDSGMIWLVGLFSFGTVQWWLSLTGTMYHYSQICTVFFCALAFWCALKKAPAWSVGLCLSAAILSRPNVIVLWPALVAIKIQIEHDRNNLIWKQVLFWSLYSSIPIIISVLMLLLYNHLRFGNLLDFGYTTISGSSLTVSMAQEYGMFSPHFIFYNLYWMFAGFLPKLIEKCRYFFPRGSGMSIFLTTPAFVYLFRRFKFSWWAIGSWIAIFLSIVVLAMYHNTGAEQYGYRYIMDFIIPIILLVSVNAGKRISIPLKILIIISIIVNYYGIISWYKCPC